MVDVGHAIDHTGIVLPEYGGNAFSRKFLQESLTGGLSLQGGSDSFLRLYGYGMSGNSLFAIRTYKQDLIDHADYYKNQVSENAALWIDLLVRFSKRKFIKIKKVPNFRYGKVHKRTKRLMARIINDKQYLVSPNFSVINEIGESDIDFSKVSNINGIYFDYDEDDKLWKITCMNPYVVFT